MLLRLAIAVWSFVAALLRRACSFSRSAGRLDFRLTPHASTSRANRKHFVSLIRSRRFVDRSPRKAALSVPAQATWLRLNLFASVSALVSSGLRLASVLSVWHHRPNRAVKRDARLNSIGDRPHLFFRLGGTFVNYEFPHAAPAYPTPERTRLVACWPGPLRAVQFELLRKCGVPV